MNRFSNGRQLSAIVIVAVPFWAVGCAEPVTPEQPTPEPWSYPSFSGDGLPASEDTDHQTYDSDEEDDGSATPTPGEGDEPAVPQLIVVDGLFSYSASSSGDDRDDPTDGFGPDIRRADMALLAKSIGCYDLFGSVDTGVGADGVYLEISTTTVDGKPQWEGTFNQCRTGPPCFDGYAIVAGEYLELGKRPSLTISSYDTHYLTVSWNTDVSSETGMTFYNCGPDSNWSY